MHKYSPVLGVWQRWPGHQLLSRRHACRFQLERVGYFCVDTDTTPDTMVVNRTCTLRETFKL